MKRTPVCVGGVVVAVGLVAVMLVLPPTVSAFDNMWTRFVIIGAFDCQLWDDMPGPGPGNEGGLLWLRGSQKQPDKRCMWGMANDPVTPQGGPVITGPLSTLVVRAAVNDGASLTVELRGPGFEFSSCFDGNIIASVQITGLESDSGFLTKAARMVPGGGRWQRYA